MHGYLESVEWNDGTEHWNGILEWLKWHKCWTISSSSERMWVSYHAPTSYIFIPYPQCFAFHIISYEFMNYHTLLWSVLTIGAHKWLQRTLEIGSASLTWMIPWPSLIKVEACIKYTFWVCHTTKWFCVCYNKDYLQEKRLYKNKGKVDAGFTKH